MSYNLRHFVNREPELAAFEARLRGREKSHVLLFHGPDGIGKTSMLYRLGAACRRAKTTYALLDFQHDGLQKAEAIIQLLGEEIGGDFSDAIGRTIEACQGAFLDELLKEQVSTAVPGGDSVSASQPAGKIDNAHIEHLEPGAVGVIATGDVKVFYIANPHINFRPEDEPRWMQQKRMRCLNEGFRQALEQLVARELVVLLFDACEYATEDAIQWLQKQLLDPLLEGALPSPANLAIVLGGNPRERRGLWLDKIAGWRDGVAAHGLSDLPPKAVRKYWIEIRGLDAAILPAGFGTRGVDPLSMVRMADYYSRV